MFRGFTYRLAPTPEQERLFVQFAGGCRLVWNLALEQRTNHWRNYQARTGNNLNYVTQCRELTLLRAAFDFIKAVPGVAQQRVLKDLDCAFRRFFNGLARFPQPKKKGQHEAFSFHGRNVSVERLSARWGRVRLPKVGWVKFRMTRDPVGAFTDATVSLTPLGWHVSIGCKSDSEVAEVGGAVGIDRGVAVPLMLSDGTKAAESLGIPMRGMPPLGAGLPLQRKKGGRVRTTDDLTAGAGSGDGRLEKIELQQSMKGKRP